MGPLHKRLDFVAELLRHMTEKELEKSIPYCIMDMRVLSCSGRNRGVPWRRTVCRLGKDVLEVQHSCTEDYVQRSNGNGAVL